MSREGHGLDWEGLLWETRGFLGLDADGPVPLGELRETAEANGWSKREFREARRDTDRLVNVGSLEEPKVIFDDAADNGDEKEPHTEDETPGFETGESASSAGEWGDADFTAPEIDVWPPAWEEYDFWMAHRNKKPRAPWNNSAKWGNSENWRDKQTVDDWLEKHPRLHGHVVLLQREGDPYTDKADPFAFVDGDDVRCPETGEVHPVFIDILEQLGLTYADISTSGSGVHALYEGKLPDGYKQANFEIDDEPWGANDDAPTVEIYDGKHVCVVTGEHVPGTTLDVVRWDEDGLDNVLDEYTDNQDRHLTSHDTDRERPELEDYEPTVTGEESTGEIRDVFYAIENLQPVDLPLRTRQVGTDATGWEKWDPSTYRTSSGGDSLHSPPGENVFHDHKTGQAFGLLSLYAAEQGIIGKPWHRLDGAEFWEAVESAREDGASIPEYQPETEAESYVVLPDSDDLTQASSSWDWRHAGTVRDGLTIDSARDRTQVAIADAYESSDQVLIEALPTMGKTTGAIRAAADTGAQITYLCPRREIMGEVAEKARDAGLDVYTLPAFTRDCDTANGEYGDEWAKKVHDWYNRGATPKDIHKNAEYELGRPLPCQEHEGQKCPYTSKWRFEPDDYDVLIGHYVHGHKPKVTQGRTVVFDEFPGGSYETVLGHTLEASVTAFLNAHDAFPFEDYADLLENRKDAERRADALLWFKENSPDDDSHLVFDSTHAHAKAPYAAFTILAAATENLGNGWERCELPGGGYGLFNRENNAVRLLMPPSLRYTSGIVALDGTPTKRMWELTLGTRLNHRQVLTGGEREEYIRDVLNLNLVSTSEYMKPYNNPDYVHVAEDRALLEDIRAQHEQKPVLITTLAAENVYEDEGVLDEVEECEHYGNLKSSNEFGTTRLGVVIGSQHYGDGFIEKWGAYAGKAIERGDGKGVDLSYGPFGDRILSHMREHETLQAAMRFGRDGNGATVYVNTAALPNWVPIAGEGRVLKVWSDGMRQVLDAANGLGSWRTADIAEHPDVTISERQVREHLNTLAERGYLCREVEGRGYVWRDDGLHRVNDHGEVEIDVVTNEDTVAEVTRMSIYTWDFRNSPGEHPDAASEPPSAGGDDAADILTEGGCDDPPPG